MELDTAFNRRRKEHQAWKEMCDVLENITDEDVNAEDNKKYRPLMVAIERWGYYEHKRRQTDPKNDKAKGLFWKGERRVI